MKIIPGALLALTVLFGQQPKEAHVTLLGKDVAYLYSEQPSKADRLPLLIFIPDQDAKAAFTQWEPAVASRGWRLAVAPFGKEAPPWSDFAAKALEAIVQDYRARAPIDMAGIYLAGEGSGAAGVFFQISRIPDLWAAALAIGGTPKMAIESNRFFAINAAATPVLWVFRDEDRQTLEPLRVRLANTGCNVTAQSAAGTTVAQALEWLGRRRRELVPQKVDCESGNPAFARCGWVEITRFDLAQRNEVLPSTRIEPGSGAFLALGGFGFDVAAPGPGVLVGWLPENYKGPLKLGDRIVSVAGREIGQARDYVRLMDQVKEEKPAAVIVLRGKERVRIESSTKLPNREEVFTGRVQAEFLPTDKEIQIITRGVAELRVRVPEQLAPARITWNGLDAVKTATAGCWLVKWGDEVKAQPCL